MDAAKEEKGKQRRGKEELKKNLQMKIQFYMF